MHSKLLCKKICNLLSWKLLLGRLYNPEINIKTQILKIHEKEFEKIFLVAETDAFGDFSICYDPKFPISVSPSEQKLKPAIVKIMNTCASHFDKNVRQIIFVCYINKENRIIGTYYSNYGKMTKCNMIRNDVTKISYSVLPKTVAPLINCERLYVNTFTRHNNILYQIDWNLIEKFETCVLYYKDDIDPTYIKLIYVKCLPSYTKVNVYEVETYLGYRLIIIGEGPYTFRKHLGLNLWEELSMDHKIDGVYETAYWATSSIYSHFIKNE